MPVAIMVTIFHHSGSRPEKSVGGPIGVRAPKLIRLGRACPTKPTQWAHAVRTGPPGRLSTLDRAGRERAARQSVHARGDPPGAELWGFDSPVDQTHHAPHRPVVNIRARPSQRFQTGPVGLCTPRATSRNPACSPRWPPDQGSSTNPEAVRAPNPTKEKGAQIRSLARTTA